MSKNSLNPIAVWALAAGGMVGGGIYTVLGVVIAISAQWSWLAFVLIGCIALPSAYSYVFLTNKFKKEGGAFAFLEKVNDKKMAGNLSWLLILGYVLTISVYAFAFGHYVSYAFHGNPLLMRGLAAGVVIGLITLNLAGVGKLSKVEIIIVSVNLLVLLALGIYGVSQWDTTQLIAGIEPRPSWSIVFGGASIFMAYEGFQLLSYEYDKIKNPEKNFMPTLLSAVAFVIIVYVLVALGATMLGGAIAMISFKQIALSVAAKSAFGTPGLIVMTIAAAFATAAAINSTLFSTANLSKRIASKNELPKWFDHTNGKDIPDRSIIVLGSLAGLLAVAGSLGSLVEAASLVFLFTFGVVNYIAYNESDKRKWLPAIGLVLAGIVGTALVFRLAISKPIALGSIILIIILITLGRPFLINQKNNKSNSQHNEEASK